MSAAVRLPRRLRGLLFAALSIVCVVTAAVYVTWVRQRHAPPAETPALTETSVAASNHARPCNCPSILFRSTVPDATFGAASLVPLDVPEGQRTITALRCERVYFAAGQGLCLTANRGMVTSYRAITFDGAFQPRHTFQLSGIPSRTRVAPDGRYAAYTIFVTGHSYAAGNFSTRTVLIDMADDREITDLEQFEVWRDGKIIRAPDFNFWGVTFLKGSERFYATLATGGTPYLVEGNIASRTAQVLYKHVECPSLSPDNTRLAFKRRTNRGWRLHVLELATMTDTPLIAETRSVDDQVEWLDNRYILYTPMVDTPTSDNVWILATDGSEPPRLFLRQAYSPVVIH